MEHHPRRPIMSIIGSGSPLPDDLHLLCLELGQHAVTAGFRIACGGMGGVMGAVCQGAHQAGPYHEGDTVAIIPSYDRNTANPFADIIIPTGMQLGRNVIVVAMADVVVAVAGGAGTLSEIALAWQLGKPIIGLEPSGGWAARLGEQVIDDRFDTMIHKAQSVEQAITMALSFLEKARIEPGDIGTGWQSRTR